jgi:hypothetical protein
VAVYSDRFIATEAEVLAAPLDQQSPAEYFPAIQAKYISPLELATLEAIVAGQTDPYALVDARLDEMSGVVVREEAGGNIMVERVPATLVEAQTWQATDELRVAVDKSEQLAWAVRYLGDGSSLAKRAQTEGKQMYLWTAV